MDYNDPDQARGVRDPNDGGGLILRKPIFFRSGPDYKVRFEIRTESGEPTNCRLTHYSIHRMHEQELQSEVILEYDNLPLSTNSELCVIFFSKYAPAEPSPTVFRLGLVEDARVADGTLRIGPCFFERDEQHPDGFVVPDWPRG